MILGRSTVQWTALITAAGGLTQLLVVQFIPDVDPTVVATVIGAVVAFLGTFIAFLANTRTTPTNSPNLKPGITGHIVGSSETFTVPTPAGPVEQPVAIDPTYPDPGP